VTGVSWYEAAAYCRWLDTRLKRPHGAGEVPCPVGSELRLPTEAEWEFAAAGTEGRRYPWGNDAPDKARANFNEAKVGAPSPVGVFPGDCTPEGVLDMAGNVWEWCRDVYQDHRSEGSEQREGEDDSAGDDAAVPRVLRGGAFVNGAGFLRASLRGWYRPGDGFQGIGFRCVLAPRRQP